MCERALNYIRRALAVADAAARFQPRAAAWADEGGAGLLEALTAWRSP
jgi:hypothetical protein